MQGLFAEKAVSQGRDVKCDAFAPSQLWILVQAVMVNAQVWMIGEA